MVSPLQRSMDMGCNQCEAWERVVSPLSGPKGLPSSCWVWLPHVSTWTFKPPEKKWKEQHGYCGDFHLSFVRVQWINIEYVFC